MKRVLFVSVLALVATVGVARAEIECSMHGGCWETGKKIRLPDSPYRGVTTTLTSRDGNGRIDVRNYPYVADTPGVRATPAVRARRGSSAQGGVRRGASVAALPQH
jgi:hypothetical protein